MQVLEHHSNDEIEYPESDGKPMAETGPHADAMINLIETLRRFTEPAEDVYVGGNMMMYYEEGNLKKCLSPDVFVLCDTHTEPRNIYKMWEEGRAPHVVIEVTSKSTRSEDEVKKADLYLQLGVDEYFQYDPTADYIKNHLKARRNKNGRWVPILNYVGATMEEGGSTMKIAFESKILGVAFCINDEKELRLWSTEEYCLLHTGKENAERVIEQRHRILRAERELSYAQDETERQRADKLKERRLKNRQCQLKERERAEKEAALLLAKKEKERADAAMREIEKLKALLGKR